MIYTHHIIEGSCPVCRTHYARPVLTSENFQDATCTNKAMGRQCPGGFVLSRKQYHHTLKPLSPNDWQIEGNVGGQ